MSVLFCKYLRNQSSDLYEIFYGGQSLSRFKFHDDQCTNVRARLVNAHAHVLSRVRASTARVRAFVHGSS